MSATWKSGHERRYCDHHRLVQHGLGSKPTCAILLCSWERHFMAHSPAWVSEQAVLTFIFISRKTNKEKEIASGQQYLGISESTSGKPDDFCPMYSVFPMYSFPAS